MYTNMTRIEENRCKSDLLYRCLISTDTKDLANICEQMLTHLHAEFDNDQMSKRLKRMTAEILSSNDRIAKHAFIFFTLNQEPKMRSLFLSPTNTLVPPEKFDNFVKNELPSLCEKLLTGSFTSLRSFTEDCRWVYLTL